MVTLVLCALVTVGGQAAPKPEERAIAALAREVQIWRPENRCCSCHHNGDAVRTLYRAEARGYKIPPRTLDETSAWLAKPAGWENNGGEGAFNDRELAALQFASALTVAVETGRQKDREPLLAAAKKVIALQQANGSWKVDTDEHPGSPATHGRPLATVLALHTLRQADAKAYADAIRKGETWLRTLEMENVYTAAAVLLGLGRDDDEAARKQRTVSLDLVRRGEAKTGGWGPYVGRATEPFDTALVLLALAEQPATEEIAGWIRRGRAALIEWQQEDGTWPATTRPGGAGSRAQTTSTTAWALWALLRTGP